MDNITIGIDFGTTNTSVAYMKYNNMFSTFVPECFDLGRSDIIRSSITYRDEDHFWIGGDALKHSYKYPHRYIDSLKRQVVSDTLRHKTFGNKTELDILADFFTKIMEGIGSQVPYNSTIGGVAIGIPIGFRDRDKELYTRALVKAGIYDNYEVASKNTIFVSEPIAAVLNYNVELRDDRRVLVFDFGGGTLDLVVMDMKNVRRANEISMHDVISKKGKLDLGGNDFDRAILENIVVEKYGIRNLKRNLGVNSFKDILSVQEGIDLMNEIRATKEDLTKYELALLAFERDKFKINMEITRDEYEMAIAPYLGEIENLVNDCLSEAGLRANNIDIVVLAGGSSMTPAVQKLLSDTFGGNKIQKSGDAMTCIARGLALRGYDPDANRYDDILEHSYGVKIRSKDNEHDFIKPILKKGQKISSIKAKEHYCEFELMWKTRHKLLKEGEHDGKNTFKVNIYEGDEEIGVAHIPLPKDMIDSEFNLYFTVDEDNERLELHIDDTKLNRKVEVPMEYRFIEMSR